jgi:hypothetical protein
LVYNNVSHSLKWHGNWYDFHGGCDLVLITNSLLDFHIRTRTAAGGWSGIVAAGIKIGNAKLVVVIEPNGQIFVNNLAVATTSVTTTFAGMYQFSVFAVSGQAVRLRLDLLGGQYIELKRAYLNTLQVDVLGHGSNFGDSRGLCANWTAISPNNLVGRNNQVFPLTNPNTPYGQEWQVRSGDPLIFQTPGVGQCTFTQLACRGVQPDGSGCTDVRFKKAQNACKNVTTERNAQQNCEFDVIQTDDANAAITEAYTDPLVGNPPERCVEAVTSNTNTTTCGKRGGRCVWRCDPFLFKCVDELCKGPDQGCSCALPKDIIVAPVTPPVKAPVKPPTRRRCGIFGLGLLCFNGCGLLRFLGFCIE